MRDKGVVLRILVCIGVCGAFLYSYVDKQNSVTERRLQIPILAKEIKDLNEENKRLQYEIDLFESPEHLMELARHSEFSHLKYPMLKEIIALQEGIALQATPEKPEESTGKRPKLKFTIGAKSL